LLVQFPAFCTIRPHSVTSQINYITVHIHAVIKGCVVLKQRVCLFVCLSVSLSAVISEKQHYSTVYIRAVIKGCKVLSQCVCLFVCMSVHSHISKTTCSNFTQFSVTVPCGRGSVLLWRQCDTLCTSSFVDDVLFIHIIQWMGRIRDDVYLLLSSPGGGTSQTSHDVMFGRVRQAGGSSGDEVCHLSTASWNCHWTL